MSEITVDTGELPICVNCQLKHAVQLYHHTDPKVEPQKYKQVKRILKNISADNEMTSKQLEDFIRANALEHKVEDALTVVRDLRKAYRTPDLIKTEKDIEETHELLRSLRHDIVEGHFPGGCPKCPEGKCSLCPPKLRKTYRKDEK